MNILIISFDADPPYMGGTSTVANVLAKNFIARGHFCALGHMEDSKFPSTFFKFKIKLEKKNKENAEYFFKKYKFDIILNQLANITDFKFLLSLPIGHCKIISAYHSRPMFHFSMFETLMRIYHDSNNLLYKVYTISKIPLIPLYNIRSREKEKKIFREINKYSHKILLLSENFFNNWLGLTPGADVSKLIAIGNPLVFERSFPVDDIIRKEKLVITVYSNPAKRAHLLLNIWGKIELDSRFNDWKFEFIGEGEGFNQIKKLASKLNLNRIIFTGYQDPYPFYKRASIMMMTSKYEGWPMVLMEGQQMGVVPVSYNSFESITDIITDGKNGYIVPNNNMDYFVHKMKYLMQNSEERHKMAVDSIILSQRFSVELVIQKYLKLFESLLKDSSDQN